MMVYCKDCIHKDHVCLRVRYSPSIILFSGYRVGSPGRFFFRSSFNLVRVSFESDLGVLVDEAVSAVANS